MCIALLLNCWKRIVHTLFCLLVLLALFKKRKPIICILLSAIISTFIVTFGSVNMYTIHKTTYNPTLRTIMEKKHSNTTQKSLAQALLVEVFLQEQRVYVSM